MRAQLPKNTNTPQQYLKSDKWGMQQKIDGWRMLLSCGEKVETFNRKGDPLECPENIVDYFKEFTTSWTFDGELVNDLDVLLLPLQIPYSLWGQFSGMSSSSKGQISFTR